MHEKAKNIMRKYAIKISYKQQKKKNNVNSKSKKQVHT